MAVNDKTIEAFLAVKTPRELADFFNLDYSRLVYRLYKTPPEKKYKSFEILKSDGSKRIISAPISPIKNLQSRLNQLLQAMYSPKKNTVFGFVRKGSVVDHATRHIKQKFVLCFDIKDFFPSINFGRVRGLFLAHPFKFPDKVATVLAQIATYENILPQGSPCSPIISNIICYKLDLEIRRLSARNRCVYSRYADDITISTSLRYLPEEIAMIGTQPSNDVSLSQRLTEIIKNNGFEVKDSKTRLKTYYQRQEVTGLTVNRFPNLKRSYYKKVRAMLYAWRTHGYEAAEREYYERYYKKQKNATLQKGAFQQIIKGKLAYIKQVRKKYQSKEFKQYKRLKRQYDQLVPSKKFNKIFDSNADVILITEGKTDWKHLKAALSRFQKKGKFKKYQVIFDEHDDATEINNEGLFERCKYYSMQTDLSCSVICIFDSDVASINKRVVEGAKLYRNWGNKTFSMVLPLPKHRSELKGIPIELMYTDDDLRKFDGNKRRLFLCEEFDPNTNRNKKVPRIVCTDSNIRKRKKAIVTAKVTDDRGVSYSLSKEKFASYVYNRELRFKSLDISSFEAVFETIEAILEN